jgi:GcrA cell cycle regulator
MSRPAQWPEADDARLRSLWDEGHSTSEIGRRMQRSKNSIVGRAHRLDLPSRPSPIVRDGRLARPKRAQSIQLVVPSVALVAPLVQRSAPRIVASKPIIRPPAPRRPVTIPTTYRSEPCCWPIGDPGTPGFRFCDEPSVKRAYCAAHAEIAYVPSYGRRELAA